MALLEVFVHGGCASEESARHAAEAIRREFPAWDISIRQLGDCRAESLGVIAAPTFALDGRIVAVGVPRTEWLLRTLREWHQQKQR